MRIQDSSPLTTFKYDHILFSTNASSGHPPIWFALLGVICQIRARKTALVAETHLDVLFRPAQGARLTSI